MFSPHLIGMAKRIIGGMNDYLGMVVGIRPTVDTYKATGPVVLRGPWTQIKPWWGDGSGNHSHPSFVAQERAVFSHENRIGKTI